MFVNILSPKYKAEHFYASAGNPVKITYAPAIDKETGVLSLVESGKVNIYNDIQAWKDSCDIHAILARFNAGDVSALNAKPVMYGDFTNVPRTLAEAYSFVNDGNKAFYSLPVEIREKFNHSASEFFARFDEFEGVVKEFEEMKKSVEPALAIVPSNPAVGAVENISEGVEINA